LFSSGLFDTYEPEDLPLDEELVLMDEKYLLEWEAAWLMNDAVNEDKDASEPSTSPYEVGYVMPAIAIRRMSHGVELSWFPNTHDRFHELKITLPLGAIVQCVEIHKYDCKPTVFVRSEWLAKVHLRNNSLFMMIDVAGMGEELENGRLETAKLVSLRDHIDEVATRHPDMSFISFADSLLVKTNWTVGMVDSGAYTYTPENLVFLFEQIRAIHKSILGLGVYAVFASGSNEYYDDALLHISSLQNHISLNSLGLPFAQIMLIDQAARKAVRDGLLEPHELYMDGDFFRSLDFTDHLARRSIPKAHYKPKLSGSDGEYFYADYDVLAPLLRNRSAANATQSSR
jgi:hypothetical protein